MEPEDLQLIIEASTKDTVNELVRLSQVADRALDRSKDDTGDD